MNRFAKSQHILFFTNMIVFGVCLATAIHNPAWYVTWLPLVVMLIVNATVGNVVNMRTISGNMRDRNGSIDSTGVFIACNMIGAVVLGGVISIGISILIPNYSSINSPLYTMATGPCVGIIISALTMGFYALTATSLDKKEHASLAKYADITKTVNRKVMMINGVIVLIVAITSIAAVLYSGNSTSGNNANRADYALATGGIAGLAMAIGYFIKGKVISEANLIKRVRPAATRQLTRSVVIGLTILSAILYVVMNCLYVSAVQSTTPLWYRTLLSVISLDNIGILIVVISSLFLSLLTLTAGLKLFKKD